MSYDYYDDASYDHHSEPVYYNPYSEPTYYDDAQSDPVYYEDTPYSDTPTPTFFDNTYPEPIHYTDTHLELIYSDDNTTWSSTIAPESYDGTERENELEAYAEAASCRTYLEDEIHPAYRDNQAYPNNPADSGYMTSSNMVAAPIHPVYHTHATSEVTSTPEHHYNDYYWPKATCTNCGRFDPPTDPSFYDTVSHDRASNEDLAITAERIGAILGEWRVWDAWDRVDHLWDLIEERRPRQDQLVHLAQHIEMILQQRRELDLGDKTLADHGDGKSNPLPQSTSSLHHNSDHEIITLPPDICIPIPLPLSPNIWSKPTRFESTFLITALKRREPRYYFAPLRRRRQPPDIRTPKPFPPAPNILVQHSSYQQPRRPTYSRPQRKHPPPVVEPLTIPTPQNCHRHARRRIFKRIHSHVS